MADRRALKTLLDTYWSPGGWRSESERRADPDAFSHAKQNGVMFDPLHVNHDAILSRLTAARDALSPRRAADAFLASLSTRRLELRSVLGSYAVFRHIERHAASFSGRMCTTCALYGPSTEAEDLNVLTFERFKWGGVRHDHPLYAALDLELFLLEASPTPIAADLTIMRCILESLRTAPAEVTSARAQLVLPKSFKSNKAERDVVLAILGFSGILRSPGHPGYREQFVAPVARELPDRRFVDMPYPACWWSAADGLDSDALNEFFGHVL